MRRSLNAGDVLGWIGFAAASAQGVDWLVDGIRESKLHKLALGVLLVAIATPVLVYLLRRAALHFKQSKAGLPSELTGPVRPAAVSKVKYKVWFPVNREQLKAANKLAKAYYSKESIPFVELEKWFQRNSLTTAVLTDISGKVVGYFDVFPVTTEFYTRLREGYASEKDLTPDRIIGGADLPKAVPSAIYLGGIAVSRESKAISGGAMVLALITYLEQLYFKAFGLEELTIGALPYTDEGLAAAMHFKLQQVIPRVVRADNHEFFERTFTRDQISTLLSQKKRASSRVDLEQLDGDRLLALLHESA